MADRNVGVGQTYATLDTALASMVAGTNVIIKDGLGDNGTGGVYIMSAYAGEPFNLTCDYTEDPDEFPVIHHTSGNFYWTFHSADTWWEKLRIKSSVSFDSGTLNFVNTFYRVHFFDCTGTAIMTMSTYRGTDQYINCLFTNCSCTSLIYDNAYWDYSNSLKFYNCTFDNAGVLSNRDVVSGNLDNHKWTNCIFSGTWTAPGNNFRSLVSNSLTSEALTGYGTGCVSDADPLYAEATRSLPSHWKIQSGSPAKAVGVSAGMPDHDMANVLRTGTWDAGIWIANSSGGVARRIFII